MLSLRATCVLAISLTCATTAIPAKAGRVMGNDLYGWCKSETPDAKYSCFGYITGVSDVLASFITTDMFRHCVPSGSTPAQAVDIVKKYLSEHPENRNWTAEALIAMALKEAWGPITPDCNNYEANG